MTDSKKTAPEPTVGDWTEESATHAAEFRAMVGVYLVTACDLLARFIAKPEVRAALLEAAPAAATLLTPPDKPQHARSSPAEPLDLDRWIRRALRSPTLPQERPVPDGRNLKKLTRDLHKDFCDALDSNAKNLAQLTTILTAAGIPAKRATLASYILSERKERSAASPAGSGVAVDPTIDAPPNSPTIDDNQPNAADDAPPSVLITATQVAVPSEGTDNAKGDHRVSRQMADADQNAVAPNTEHGGEGLLATRSLDVGGQQGASRTVPLPPPPIPGSLSLALEDVLSSMGAKRRFAEPLRPPTTETLPDKGHAGSDGKVTGAAKPF